MGLITCPDCETEISELAVSCPRCGRPCNSPTGPRGSLEVKRDTPNQAMLLPAQVIAGGESARLMNGEITKFELPAGEHSVSFLLAQVSDSTTIYISEDSTTRLKVSVGGMIFPKVKFDKVSDF